MPPVTMSRHDAIGDVSDGLWRSAVQHRFRCSPEWLSMLEANGFGQARSYTVAQTADGSGLGALCAYLVDERGPTRFQPLGLLTDDELVAPWLSRLPDGELDATRDAIVRLADAGVGRAAVCVAPFGYEHALRANDPKLLPDLVAELRTTADRWDCPTKAVLYVDARERGLRDALTAAGYTGWISGARCELPIAWSSMDDYVASMKSHRRTKIRREIAHFKEGGMEVSSTPLPPDTTTLARLAALQEDKYGHGYEPEFQNMVLQNFRNFVGRDCFAIVGSRSGEPIGYEIVFRDRDTWRVGLCGWDDTGTSPGEYAYFNVGYYRLIEFAIRDGVTLVDYGVEAYEAKLNRGCVLRPLWSYAMVPDDRRSDLERVAGAHLYGMRQVLGNDYSVPAEFLEESS